MFRIYDHLHDHLHDHHLAVLISKGLTGWKPSSLTRFYRIMTKSKIYILW